MYATDAAIIAGRRRRFPAGIIFEATRLVAMDWGMRGTAAIACAFVLIGATLMPRGAGGAAPGLVEIEAFGSNPGNLRMFAYRPARPARPAPLVVALHGCSQSAENYDDESGWTRVADERGLYLLLPQQKRRNNLGGCFNWHRPRDARRDRGEALSIRQMIDKAKAIHRIDSRQVFITGISAGGAMTSVMLAAYPEVFAGGGIIAGVAFGCADGLRSALRCMYRGDSRTAAELGRAVLAANSDQSPWPRVSVWHGDSDPVVDPANATAIVRQWTAVHGLDLRPDRVESVKGAMHEVYQDAQGRALVEVYRVPGMGHSHPVDPGHGPRECGESGLFFSDVGLCASHYMADFWGLKDRP